MRYILMFLCTLSTYYGNAQIQLREEFNGPFASWANVKTRFGATGDGKQDDTKALQTAIDSLTVHLTKNYKVNPRTSFLVLYLPAGTYKVSNTLRVEGKIGFTIIGEDPEKTIIKWAGKPGDTMMVCNGSSYFKISRLTWDANKIKNMEALGLHWLDKEKGTFAATSVEFSDMMFTGGLSYGIFGGTFGGNEGVGANDAEVVIRRCRFYNCDKAAIAIKGYNTLDYWVWNCNFNDCARGIQCQKGNYHVYNSTFSRSYQYDLFNDDGYYVSARGCYSQNSWAFSFDNGGSCNAFKRIFQGNIVNGFGSVPIEYHSQGRITMLDNAFYNRPGGKINTILNYSSWCPANYEVLSLGNNFEHSEPINLPKNFSRKIFTGLNQGVSGFKAKIAKPAMPSETPFPLYTKRKVFEISASASTAQIQAAVNEAAKLKGQRPIIHFANGNYTLEKEIVIPADTDMQLIGDGILFATIFNKKAGSANPYCFVVKGPSYITMQQFQISIPKDQNGILFENVDQQKSEVHIDQPCTQVQTTIFTDRLNYTYIEKNNSFYSSGHELIGGDKMPSGKGTAVLYCFGGQSTRTLLRNNAVMVAKDCWWEGAYKKEYLPLDLNGEGRFTLDGAMISPRDQDTTATIRINNFKGAVTISDIYVYGGLDINNNAGNLKVLIWNVNLMKKQNPASFVKGNFKPALAMLGITTQCYKNETAFCRDDGILSFPNTLKNVSNIDSFIENMTQDLRTATPRAFRNLGNKISNIYIYRVAVSGGNTAFRFQQ